MGKNAARKSIYHFFCGNVGHFKGQSCIPGSSLIAGKIVQVQVKTILIANEISHFKIYQPGHRYRRKDWYHMYEENRTCSSSEFPIFNFGLVFFFGLFSTRPIPGENLLLPEKEELQFTGSGSVAFQEGRQNLGEESGKEIHVADWDGINSLGEIREGKKTFRPVSRE